MQRRLQGLSMSLFYDCADPAELAVDLDAAVDSVYRGHREATPEAALTPGSCIRP